METNRSQIGGVALITLGALLVLGRSFGGSDFSWPLFVLVPGLLLVGAAVWEEKRLAVLALPGSVVAAVGLILFVQNITGAFETWAYAWALLIAALGVGQIIRKASSSEVPPKSGVRLVQLGLVLFAAFGGFFELFIFGDAFSGQTARLLVPLLFIGAGTLLLSRPQPLDTPERAQEKV